MKNLKYLPLAFLFFIQSINAQNIIMGRVLDSSSYAPVGFATLTIKNKAKGAICDENGLFSLTYDAQKDTVVISCIGYKSMILTGTIPKNKEILLTKAVIDLPELVITPVEKECKKYKIKFNPASINYILYEGTIIKRKINIQSSYLCGFGIELQSDYEAKLIIRPHFTNSNLEPLLTRDYVLEKTLQKGKLTPIHFDFTETLPIDGNTSYFLGLEILYVPGNNNYSNHIQIICSDDPDKSSEVVSIYNYIQEDGTIKNFGKQMDVNIKLHLKTSK